MHSNSAPRRRHSTELKTKVLAACDEPGASISGVALAHGLNANLVRKWRSGRGVKLAGVMVAPAAPGQAPTVRLGADPEFVAIELPASSKTGKTPARVAAGPADASASAERLIQIELRRGALHLNVRWPISAAEDCTAWLCELSSGLLK